MATEAQVVFNTFSSKNITFPKHVTNFIIEHRNVFFDVMFPYVDNTFLSHIMHIFTADYYIVAQY